MRKILLGLVLVASLLFAGSAFAAPKSGPTLQASPNPTTVNTQFEITGCGYSTSEVNLSVNDTYATYFFQTPVTGGCIDALWFTTGFTGTYTIQAGERLHHKNVIEATATLSVF